MQTRTYHTGTHTPELTKHTYTPTHISDVGKKYKKQPFDVAVSLHRRNTTPPSSCCLLPVGNQNLPVPLGHACNPNSPTNPLPFDDLPRRRSNTIAKPVASFSLFPAVLSQMNKHTHKAFLRKHTHIRLHHFSDEHAAINPHTLSRNP